MNAIIQKSPVRVLATIAMAFVLTLSIGGMFPVLAHADDTYDEYFSPYGNDIYDEYFSPYGNDIYDEYFSPYGNDIYDEYFSPYGNDIYDEYFSPYEPNDVWEPVQVYDAYDVYDVYTVQDGVGYSYAPTPSYSTPSYFAPASFSFRAPSTSYSYSAPQPQRPVQQQQQQQQQQQNGQPITIVNTNNNNNVNTNVNTVSVIPVAQTPATYPVQYVYPQQPVYPIYPTYPTYPIYPTTNAYCVITATQGSIANGQAAYLSWSSSGATSAWLSDGIGAVAVNGSLAVRPNVSKAYTLTVSGYGGTNTCNAYVTVQGSYISLSQIPYTGFDAGLLGNALYWLSIISFAVAGAYLAVYYVPGTLFSAAGKTQVLAFANSAKSSHQSDAYETVRIPEESKLDVVEAPVETMTPSPVDVMENLPVAPTAKQTTDSMTVEISKEGDAPRIVINRS